MQTSALTFKHAVNERSFSKRRGSGFLDSISIVSFCRTSILELLCESLPNFVLVSMVYFVVWI